MEKKGFVEVSELKRLLGEQAGLVSSFDVSGDGVMDLAEFMAMMCPVGYKPQLSEDQEGQVLARLVEAYMQEARVLIIA